MTHFSSFLYAGKTFKVLKNLGNFKSSLKSCNDIGYELARLDMDQLTYVKNILNEYEQTNIMFTKKEQPENCFILFFNRNNEKDFCDKDKRILKFLCSKSINELTSKLVTDMTTTFNQEVEESSTSTLYVLYTILGVLIAGFIGLLLFMILKGLYLRRSQNAERNEQVAFINSYLYVRA